MKSLNNRHYIKDWIKKEGRSFDSEQDVVEYLEWSYGVSFVEEGYADTGKPIYVNGTSLPEIIFDIIQYTKISNPKSK